MKKVSSGTLISSILFLIVGIILFTDPASIVKFISYFFGGILIGVGIYRCVNYYIQDKRLGVVNNNELAFGITAFILGLLFIVLASAIEFLIRIFFGVYLILIGISKIYQTFFTNDRTSKFYALIVVGVVFLLAGIYTIVRSNLELQLLGIFMIIYGITDFISYFVYRNGDSTDNSNINVVDNNVKEAKIVKEIATENVEVEEVVEDKKSTKKTKKQSKKKEKDNK